MDKTLFFMNTLIVSTFDCTFEYFDKFVSDFHEKEGQKYVEEYELIKVNEHKSHLILKVKDLEGFAAAIRANTLNNKPAINQEA